MNEEGVTQTPTIGLSFLFRDDKETIGAMLDSFLPHVHEVVAVDTGSVDGTREIVEQKFSEWRQGRTEIIDFVWVEDFAVARQAGWDLLQSDWGLWGDADDTLVGGETLKHLVERADLHQGQLPIGGFIFQYDYARTAEGQNICILPRERLLRMAVGWNWVSPVHEVAIAKTPCEFVSVDSAIWVHHKQPNEMQGDRNISIIKRHMREAEANGVDPDPRMIAYLGVEFAARGEHADAIAAYKRYIPLSGWGEEKHQVIHRMADSYRAQGKFDNAIECETYAITHTAEHEVGEWPDHFFGIAEAMMGKSQWKEALSWFERGSCIGAPVSSMILNPRDYDYGPALGQSICYFELGDYGKSAEFARIATQILPGEVKAQSHSYRVAVKLREKMATDATIQYLESLIAYDENLKAAKAISLIPYVARGNNRVFELVNHIRRSTYQIGSTKGYEHMYATNREVRNPDAFVDDASSRFGRAALLRRGLEAQAVSLGRKPIYLDAGSNDGWMGAHMQVIGAVERADGIDLNPTAIDAARDRVERLGLDGTYEVGFVEDAATKMIGEAAYDAISMFEVFEHLEDPHRSVGELERALADGGVMYISTPNGAFEKGLIDIKQWAANENKQHLRAVTNAEFARFALQRGWLLDVETGQHDGVQVVAYEPSPRKGRVVLYLGPAWDRWSPMDLTTRGLGGSETAAVKLATGLAAQGWFVDVYGGVYTEGPYDGVMYQNWTMYDADEHCDIFISSRDCTAVSKLVPDTSVKILWLHDSNCGGLLSKYINDFDVVWCLTNAHTEHIRKEEGVDDSSYDDLFQLTRNGIDLEHFQEIEVAKAREHTVIYSSSPDRGLEPLLDMWPEIIKRVPRARLKIFYGFETFDQMNKANPAMKAWKAALLKKIASVKGVKLMGRVSQDALHAEQLKARVWAYPYGAENPTETSCITAMESMAAGLFCVTTDTGALAETIGNGGVLVPGDVDEPAYRKKFVDAVVLGMTNDPIFQNMSNRARLRSAGFGWDDVVTQWDSFFTGRLDELRDSHRSTGLPAEVRH